MEHEKDYHGFWSETGFNHKTDCEKRRGQSVPECCGGYDKEIFHLSAILTCQCYDFYPYLGHIHSFDFKELIASIFTDWYAI